MRLVDIKQNIISNLSAFLFQTDVQIAQKPK